MTTVRRNTEKHVSVDMKLRVPGTAVEDVCLHQDDIEVPRVGHAAATWSYVGLIRGECQQPGASWWVDDVPTWWWTTYCRPAVLPRGPLSVCMKLGGVCHTIHRLVLWWKEDTQPYVPAEMAQLNTVDYFRTGLVATLWCLEHRLHHVRTLHRLHSLPGKSWSLSLLAFLLCII